jgi:choice-of-anchor A domain-containing protein
LTVRIGAAGLVGFTVAMSGCNDWVAKDTASYDLLGVGTETVGGEPCTPQTECLGLAPVEDFNVVVLHGAFDSPTDVGSGLLVEGGLAATSVTLDSFDIGGGDAETPIAVLARDKVTMRNGQVHGDVVCQAGEIDIESVGLLSGADARIENLSYPFNFELAASELARTSKLLAGLAPNGSVTDNVGHGLELSGTDPEQIVFRIAAEQVDRITDRGIYLDVPDTALVLINVYGASPRLANHRQVASPNKVLWNFPEATELTLDSVSFLGSILAPTAHLVHGHWSLEGTLVVSTIETRGTLFEVPLEGCFLVETCTSGAP